MSTAHGSSKCLHVFSYTGVSVDVEYTITLLSYMYLGPIGPLVCGSVSRLLDIILSHQMHVACNSKGRSVRFKTRGLIL